MSLLGLRHRFPVSRFWYQLLLYLGVEPGVEPRALGFSRASLVPVLLSYALWWLLCACVYRVRLSVVWLYFGSWVMGGS